jgi:hypothetical protein
MSGVRPQAGVWKEKSRKDLRGLRSVAESGCQKQTEIKNMNTITIQAAREILAAEIELTDEQVSRCIESATADAAQWIAENDLPQVTEMELDWHIDRDIKDAGVNSYAMQKLSFAIATA